MEYLDFKLEINRVSRRYEARVRSAPAGTGARVRVTLSAKKLEDLRTSLGISRSGGGARNLLIETPQPELASDLGLQLFHSIFHDEVLESWRISQAQAPSRLRLRLSLDNDPSLLSIPWELLFDPELNDFVATVMPVVRSLELRTDHQRSLAGPIPLRILTVLSCPFDCAPIGIGQEWSAMDGVLGGSVEMRSVPPRLEKIDQALQEEEWHVLHFVGHGHTDARGGVLVLEDQEGGSRPIGHLRLSKFLGHPSLRLIVLNACDGGQPGRKDAFSGVAQALLRKGIPAVVAMQQPISDKAAISFARELYGAIAKGLPLDGALAVARERLYRDFETVEWAIPVLYLNAPNGEIFGPAVPIPLPSARPKSWIHIAGIMAGVLILSLITWLSWRQWSVPAQSLKAPLPAPAPVPVPVPLRRAIDNPPECTLPEGLEIAFVKIDPGTFEMGDEGMKDSRPIHQVTITRPFCLGVYEVTQELWNWVLGWPAPSKDERLLPVRGVTFQETQQFFERLNSIDPSAHYRLPFEAEWELAARAGRQMRYSFGDDEEALPIYGNCNDERDKHWKVAPVGQLKETFPGLFDLHGNVFEWVQDRYGTYPDKDLKDPRGPEKGDRRIRRGGSWSSSPRSCSSAARSNVEPDRQDRETGFRIVRDIR